MDRIVQVFISNSSQPARITWSLDDLVSSDAHRLRCRFSASVRVADTEADRRMFDEVLLQKGARFATADGISQHFLSALRAAAGNAIAGNQADAWMTSDRSDLQKAMLDAVRPLAFACGIEFLPPFHIEIESPTLERQRLESVQRARAEERAAAQVQHLQHATELLKQFQQMRQQTPQLSPGRLLDQIAPADRGLTLQSLLMSSDHPSMRQELWAVAGPFLVKIDARGAPAKIEMFSLPTDLGPLRSVQSAELAGRRALLVGARGGVFVVEIDSPDHATAYRDDSISSQLGFNRAVASEERIWACHGEAGVVGWKLDSRSEPFARHRVSAVEVTPAPDNFAATSPSIGSSSTRSARTMGPRNLQLLDADSLLFSTGGELHLLSEGNNETIPAISKSEVVAILPAERNLFVVHQDGTIARLDRAPRRIVDHQRRAAGISAAGILPWLDSERVLLAEESGPVDCIGMDDSLSTQYLSAHRGLRALSAAADIIAAISLDRQRIIIWRSWEGKAPAAEIHLTAQTRHRIADIEFC